MPAPTAIRDAANAFCQEKLFPRVLMANRKEHFDREIMNEFGEMGFLGATLEGQQRIVHEGGAPASERCHCQRRLDS